MKEKPVKECIAITFTKNTIIMFYCLYLQSPLKNGKAVIKSNELWFKTRRRTYARTKMFLQSNQVSAIKFIPYPYYIVNDCEGPLKIAKTKTQVTY